MNRQIKMSYADKNVRLTLDETSKLIKVEVRKEGEDSTKFREVSSKWIGKVPAVGELEEVLKEVTGVKPTKKGLFECFDSLKDQLFDAPTEVKESFNKMIRYFDTEYFENFGWWLVDATDKNSGQTSFMVLPRPISEYAKCKIGDEWSRMIYNYRAVKGPFKSKEEAEEAYEKMKGSHTPRKVEVNRGKG